MAELPPQFVAIDGLANFRDIGGWPIEDKDGKTVAKVRKGVFYRGPDTSTVTPVGLAKLKELGVTADFDLRSKGQIEKAGGPSPLEGIERIWAPAFPDGEYSPEKAASRYVQYASDGTELLGHMTSSHVYFGADHVQGIVQAFTDILIHGAPAARIMLLHIASLNPDSPSACYIHCTTGNNRSGVFIGVILSLLGVKPKWIAEEYSLSDIGLRPTRDAVVARLMKSPVFAGSGGGGRERAERMVGARPESMLAMLEMVDKKWGGAEGYFKTMAGLTDEEIEKVRQILVVREGAIVRKRAGSVWETTKALATKLWDSFA